MIGIGTHRMRVSGIAGFNNQSSVLFDGVDELVNIDLVRTALASTTVGTWTCWVKPVDATPAGNENFISFGDTDAETFMTLRIVAAGLLFASARIAGVNQWVLDTDAAAFSDNTWTHIALVQDGVSPSLFVNGILVAQTLISGADDGAWFNDIGGLDTGRIGNLNFNNEGEIQYFNGNIDEPRFWNIALSAAQILDDYNSGVPKTPLATGLVSSFRMGDAVITSYSTNSYLLDGSNERIDIDDVRTALASTTVGTWSCWVRPVDATPGTEEVFISFGDTDANTRISLSIGITGLLLAFAGSTLWNLDTDAAAFSDNTWTHIALVQDGTEPVLYVDGVAVAQAFGLSPDRTGWFNDIAGLDNGRIGDRNFNNNGEINHFNGNIDDVLFVNRDLSAAQVLNIFNSGLPKDESGIANGVSLFRMGEDDTFSGGNWTVVDAIGSNNGASVNMEESDRESGVDPVLTFPDQTSSNDATSVNLETTDVVSDVPA